MAGMFGGNRFAGGIQFPQIDPYQAQGFSGGTAMGGAPAMADPPASGSKPGLFSRRGVGVDILGGIADGILAVNGMRPVYQPLQDERRARAQAVEEAELKARLEAQYRRPAAPHYWETNNGSLGVIGPDGKLQILYQDPTPKVDYTPVKNADGTTTLYPTVNGQLVGGGARAAPAGPPAGVTFTPLPAQGGAGSGPRTFR